ncbi:MAG: hypothetical protein LBI74_06175 [Synergistaceae bacterium]|jgi:5-methylcytosine-specific restriction protein A|nr:hypothetical protein [Synergistaceae bacterium]
MESWNVDILQLSTEEWTVLLNNGSVFSTKDIEMLQYVLDCPSQKSTASDIAVAFNVHPNKITAINRGISKRILRTLSKKPQKNDQGGHRYWNICFMGDIENEENKDGHFWWILRPNLAEALRRTYPV